MILFIRKILAAATGKKKASDDLAAGYVARNSMQLFILICTSMVLGFVSNYVLVKLVGVSDYGSYVYIFNLFYLASAFCIAGTDNLLTQRIAIYEGQSKHGELKGIIRFSLLLVLVTTIIVTVIANNALSWTGTSSQRTDINWWLISFLSLLTLSVIALNQASLRGLKKIFFSQVAERLIRPLLLIIVVLVIFLVNGSLRLPELIWSHVATLGAAVLVTFLLLRKSLPVSLSDHPARYETRNWMNAAFAFLLLDIFSIINSRIDVFLLGLYRPDIEVGVYNIALRVSEVVGFGLVIINFVIAPLIAKAWANKELASLQNLLTRSARAVAITGLPLALLIILFRQPILSFFDVNILSGSFALLILCLGQVINILCGSVGLVLVMTGFQKFSIISLLAGTLLNILLNVLLTPQHGLAGTAIATASGLVAWNLLMYYFTRKKLKIRTTALGTL